MKQKIIITSRFPINIDMNNVLNDCEIIKYDDEIIENVDEIIKNNSIELFRLAKKRINCLKKNIMKKNLISNELNEAMIISIEKNETICNVLISHQGILSQGSFVYVPSQDNNQYEHINEALQRAFNDQKENEFIRLRNNLSMRVRMLYDVSPLFSSTLYISEMCRYISAYYRYDDIDYVVGIEPGGICVGVGLANYLKKPFEVLKLSKSKKMELSKIPAHSRVLLVDNILSMSTIEVANSFIEIYNVIVVDCCVLKSSYHWTHEQTDLPITVFLF